MPERRPSPASRERTARTCCARDRRAGRRRANGRRRRSPARRRTCAATVHRSPGRRAGNRSSPVPRCGTRGPTPARNRVRRRSRSGRGHRPGPTAIRANGVRPSAAPTVPSSPRAAPLPALVVTVANVGVPAWPTPSGSSAPRRPEQLQRELNHRRPIGVNGLSDPWPCCHRSPGRDRGGGDERWPVNHGRRRRPR